MPFRAETRNSGFEWREFSAYRSYAQNGEESLDVGGRGGRRGGGGGERKGVGGEGRGGRG